MKSRKELLEQQEQLLQVYEKVREMLSGYPNVVNIGIGMKEKEGNLTEEGCIKIVVSHKMGEPDLEPDQIIPKEVEGVPTDIIVQKRIVQAAVCATDSASYRPIQGGIQITNIRGTSLGGQGTLGCLAQRNSDDSWVILSNHHVLYFSDGEDGDKIGQPLVTCSWCCQANVIAENVDKDESLDCAIASVVDDISIQNVIVEIGDIVGTNSPVNGERVRKRGARTGYTSGTISFISPSDNQITINPNPNGGPADDPGGCNNFESGVNLFAYHGDSGSVVVNDDNEVIALLFAVSGDYTQGFAYEIGPVEAALNITVQPTSTHPGQGCSYFSCSRFAHCIWACQAMGPGWSK